MRDYISFFEDKSRENCKMVKDRFQEFQESVSLICLLLISVKITSLIIVIISGK